MTANLADVEREIDAVTKRLAQLKTAATVLREIEAKKAEVARRQAQAQVPAVAKPAAVNRPAVPIQPVAVQPRPQAAAAQQSQNGAGQNAGDAAYRALRTLGERRTSRKSWIKLARTGFDRMTTLKL